MTEPRVSLSAARSGLAISVTNVAGSVISFFLGVVTAALFGASGVTDAYFMASSTAELTAKILLGGALTSVFLPTFVRLRTTDATRADRAFRAIFSLALITFLALGGMGETVSRHLVSFLAPGFSPDVRALTTVLLRLVLPSYLLAFLAELATVPLHASRRFALPAVSRLAVPAVTLLVLLGFAGVIGIRTLAVGATAGNMIHLLVLLTALWQRGFRLRLTAPFADPEVGRVLMRTLPFALPVLAAYGAGIVYRILVSDFPEGSLASLKFAEKIFQMTNAFFLGAITQVAFPAFARAVSSEDPGAIREKLRTTLSAVLFLGLPLTAGLLLLRAPLTRVLFERGAFTPEATAATVALVPLFVVGLVGNGVSSVFGHLALAFEETRKIIAVNVAFQALAAAFFLPATRVLGVGGLALVSGLGPFLLTGLYVSALRRRLPSLSTIIPARTWTTLLASTALCAVTVAASRRVVAPLPPAFLPDLTRLALGAAVGGSAYLLAAWLLRVPEVRTLRELARDAVRRLVPLPAA